MLTKVAIGDITGYVLEHSQTDNILSNWFQYSGLATISTPWNMMILLYKMQDKLIVIRKEEPSAVRKPLFL
jgi:hypothetical protein